MPKSKNKKNKKKNKRTMKVVSSDAKQLVKKLKGRGFYSGFLSDMGGLVGSGLGALVGNSGLGGKIGSGLGSIASKITGFGAYKVNSNTLLADTGPPVFSTGAEGSVIVSRREFVGDVRGSINFVNNVFPLNPGNPALFPWLSQMAHTYEQYEILGCILEYRPTSGSAIASTNNALGVVIMTTNYDVLDSNFTTKQAMEAYQYTVSTVPSSGAIHAIECKRDLNVLSNMYVRQFIQPENADARFYDLGKFQLATVGMQSDNITIGELWISYHVKLLKPRLEDSQLMAFYGAGTNPTLESVPANPIYSANGTNPTPTQITIPAYTSSAGGLSVALELPGNYRFTALTEYTGTSSIASSSMYATTTGATNVQPVGALCCYNQDTFAVTDWTQLASATAHRGLIGSGTGALQTSITLGGLNVGLGGGVASFTNGGGHSSSTATSVYITYDGYQSNTILAGVTSSLSSRRQANSRYADLERRLKQLELTDIKESDEVGEELVLVPKSKAK